MSKSSRPFSSGSRLPPDPIDKYLMQYKIYRKHTARDSSSLFRAVSEQIFGCQNYHEFVREICVQYMTNNKLYFIDSVGYDIDEYLRNMLRLRTSGTLLELKAMAYLFNRNVVLYESYNTGNWFVNESCFHDNFMVFATAENHFDSVYQQDYVEDAAFCQSLVYEILYSFVYQLPDVIYAVERMLHDTPDSKMVRSYNYEFDNYPERVCLADGRVFLMDRPEFTKCILDNYLLCHFHNSNFAKLRQALQNEVIEYQQQSHTEAATQINKMLNSLLPDRYMSCVRQLLSEGITPFPYKVAKALDPDIYRNIEYDSWSDLRKEVRMRSWNYTFQIGGKCNVRLANRTHLAYIQAITPNRNSCEVYVESIAEKRTIPYSALIPFSRPWQSQNRITRSGVHKYVRYHGEMSRRYYGNSGGGGFRGNLRPLRCILPADSLLLSQNDSYGIKNTVKRKCRNYSKDEKSCNDFFRCNIDFELSSSKSLGGSNKYDNPYDLRDLTALSNFKPMPSAITAAPLLEQNTNPPVRHHTNRLVPSHNKNTNPKHTQQKTNNSGDGGDSKPATHIKTQPASQKVDTDYKPEQESRNYFSGNEFTSNPFDGVIQQNQHNPGMDVMYAGHRFERNRHYYASQSSHHPNESSGWQHSMPVNNYGYYPTPSLNNNVNSIPVRRRDLLQQQFPVSFEVMPSFDIRGSDIPSDMATIRFFYNLGHDYFSQLQERHSVQAISQLARCSSGCGPSGSGGALLDSENVFDSSCTDNEAISALGNDFNKIKLEKSSNNKNDAQNRRASGWRGSNKRHYTRQTNGSGMANLNSGKNGGQSKDGIGHQSDELGCDGHVLQQNIRSGRTTPSGAGGINASMQPYIQIAPQQYPQYIPFCPIEGGDQSMFMPYGIYPPVTGYTQYITPPMPLAAGSNGEIDLMDGKFAYYQPQAPPPGPQPIPHTMHSHPISPFLYSPQHQPPVGIAPQGFWYPPPQSSMMPQSPQPAPVSPTSQSFITSPPPTTQST